MTGARRSIVNRCSASHRPLDLSRPLELKTGRYDHEAATIEKQQRVRQRAGRTLYARLLRTGHRLEAAWSTLNNADLAAFKAEVAPRFTKFATSYKPNEGVTEKDLIFPVLQALGWADALVQQQVSSRRRDDIPDALLFASAELKAAANKEKEPAKRYRHGLAVVEAKRWQRPLDRADAQGTPSSQMLRYLRRAEEASDGKLEWGILTNGRQWRLYWQGARSRAEEFLELDLPTIWKCRASAWTCLRRVLTPTIGCASSSSCSGERRSFGPTPLRSFHAEALRQTRKWEAKVAEGLTEQVFGEVFPELVRSLARAEAAKVAPRSLNENELEDVRRAALTLLYRLLFVLYAEDRRLLPVDHPVRIVLSGPAAERDR